MGIAMAFASCDSYLDTMPDNRAEIDTEDKVSSLITSAYPTCGYQMVNELMGDDVDDMGSRYNAYTDRFVDQVYAWKDVTESSNDAPLLIWEAFYGSIASANQALASIEEMGGATTTTLKECKAEALMCRAFGHFILVNEFCLNYNPETSTTDLGIPYAEAPETNLYGNYTRGTVAEVYEKIDRDIQEALPLVGDSHLSVSKYHFNEEAAYAFAARFYLFYQKWDKVVEYASHVLGSSPKAKLRDWDAHEALGITNDLTPRWNKYIDASDPANLLLIPTTSSFGLFESNYRYLTKYSHNSYIASTEDVSATNIWGSSSMMRCRPMVFKGGAMDRTLIAKCPYMFEETDPVSKIGYYKSVYPAFKGDLLLLERAEAYVMLKKYTEACADLTTWMQNWTKSTKTLTTETINSFYGPMAYYQWNAPTQKRHLHPAFTIDAEGSTQENMLQCVLNFRRQENLLEGMRWWDIKRYGITIYRRTFNADGVPETVTDSLTLNDPRRAIQLPSTVIEAGMQPNPKGTTQVNVVDTLTKVSLMHWND